VAGTGTPSTGEGCRARGPQRAAKEGERRRPGVVTEEARKGVPSARAHGSRSGSAAEDGGCRAGGAGVGVARRRRSSRRRAYGIRRRGAEGRGCGLDDRRGCGVRSE
jgi:hypothetical protein